MTARAVLSAAVFATVLAAGAEVVTWPAAPGTAATDGAYGVSVNGKPVDVVFLEKPSMADGQLQWKGGPDNLHPYYFVQFDADEEVTVAVESTNDLSRTRILPTRRGIVPAERTAHRVVFRAKPPFKVSFEPQARHRALVFAANLPERDVPRPDEKGVVWFGPGRRRFDRPIELKAGETMYLAPGAWVEGVVRGRGDGITIRGRGVLSQACWGWCKAPHRNMIEIAGKGCRLLDFTNVGAAQWCIVLDGCVDALVDGVNLLNGHVLNDDGIDIVGCRGTTIRNAFIRTQDDCITPKYWCEDLTVENVVLWTDVANNFRFGYECLGRGYAFRNCRVRGVDILHQSIRKTRPGGMWSENAVYIQASNDMPFEDISFEDIRFDAPETGDNLACIRTQRTNDQWQQHKEPGDIRRVTFRDIAFPNGLPEKSEPVWIGNVDPKRTVDGIVFENLGAKVELITEGRVGRVVGL